MANPLTISEYRKLPKKQTGLRRTERPGVNRYMSAKEFTEAGWGREGRLQAACVEWFRSQPGYRNLLLFSSLNGANLVDGGRQWKRLEREGALSGVPDLQLVAPSGDLAGLFIEMKTQRGKQSAEQIDFESKAVAAGYGYVMPRSLDEFMRVVKQYLEHGTY